MFEGRGWSTGRATGSGAGIRARSVAVPVLAVLMLTAGATAVATALRQPGPGDGGAAPVVADAAPDPRCAGFEPAPDRSVWWRCVAAWAGQPIERAGADYVASYQVGRPDDVSEFRYTPVGRAQLLALGLTVQNADPGPHCPASGGVCEIPAGTPLAGPGTYVTQAEYVTPRGAQTVDWFVEIVARP